MMRPNVINLFSFAEKAKSTQPLTPQGLIDWRWELSSRAPSLLVSGVLTRTKNMLRVVTKHVDRCSDQMHAWSTVHTCVGNLSRYEENYKLPNFVTQWYVQYCSRLTSEATASMEEGKAKMKEIEANFSSLLLNLSR